MDGNYAMGLMVHGDTLKATTFNAGGGDAILQFRFGILTGNLSLHVPLSVAQATADAFNQAMAEHENPEPAHDPDFTYPRPEPIEGIET